MLSCGFSHFYGICCVNCHIVMLSVDRHSVMIPNDCKFSINTIPTKQMMGNE